MRRKKKIELCPKCKVMTKLTNHHIYPKRHFQDSQVIRLCRLCHDELELLIPFKKLKKKEYVKILQEFLKEVTDEKEKN